MNCPAYIYIIAPMQLSYVPCQPIPPSPPFPPSINSSPTPTPTPGFFPEDSFQRIFYPLTHSNSTLPSEYHLAHSLPSPHIFKNGLADSNAKHPSSAPHNAESRCGGSHSSIKMQESAVGEGVEGGCRARGGAGRGSVDRDYNPHRQEKKVSRKRLHQNQNRNVIPNEINQIISFVQKRNKSGHLLAVLFERFPPERQSYSIPRFYLYQSLLKEKIGHYTNQRSLRLITQLYEPECRIWQVSEQRYYNKLCRLLVRHFLLEDSIFMILTSKRMKRSKKIDHLRARRVVAERVFEMLRTG